ncbi:MAG: HYR domain-containing protein [Myxococcaceae bacterium]|nr:HYR domain-containing protein [Myxococcaceae bacterium]
MRSHLLTLALVVSAGGCADSPPPETPAPAVRRLELRPEAVSVVKEIVPQGGPSGALPPLELVATSRYVFFSTEATFDKLWRTDGTAEGTVLLRDVNPSSNGGISELTAVGERVFFSVDDGASGLELWVSDGSREGTRMVKDLVPGPSYKTLENFTATAGLLYFTAKDGSAVELWKSDGTEAGTVRVFQFGQGAAPQRGALFTAHGATLYFQGYHPTTGYDLWKTDGTEAGTVLVADLLPIGNVQQLTSADGLLYFLAEGTVYRTDGTPGGTVRLVTRTDGYPTSFDELAAFGSRLLFTAYDTVHGDALWLSDGTPEGTKVLQDLDPTSRVTGMSKLTACGPSVYFDAVPQSLRHELWRTDGTSAGTQGLVRFADSVSQLTCAGDRLFFLDSPDLGRARLGVSDGSPTGTVLLAEFKRGLSTELPAHLTRWGDRLAFIFEGSPASRIWLSDGTTTGTAEIPLVARTLGTGTNVEEWIEVGGELMFTAMEWSGSTTVVHPWLTDGTPEGTSRLDALLESPVVTPTRRLVKAGPKVFFVGASGLERGAELWGSDGTNGGTHEVKDIWPGAASSFPKHLAAMNGLLYFHADDGTNGRELWRSDGTEAGTWLLKDLNPAAPSSEPAGLVTLGGFVYFSATDGVAGRELWRTDGTPEGTTLVADLRPGAVGSTPEELAVFGGKLYFTADDGTTGRELWRLDSGGLVRLADIYAGSSGSFPGHLMETSTGLYFVAWSDTSGNELFRVEGDTAVLVADIFPGTGGSDPRPIAASGNVLYFAATDATHGRELWRTDGTSGGTFLVKDIAPGSESSFTREGYRGDGFTLSDGSVLFAAIYRAEGRELWRTDGTEAGTVPVLSMMPGPESSQPVVMAEIGGRVLLLVADPASGSEVRSFSLATLNDKVPPTVSCPELTAEAVSADGAAVSFSVMASDDLGGAVEISSARTSGSMFPLGPTEFEITATDEAGNSASCTAKVRVQDTTAPVVQCPASFSAQATEPSGGAPAWTLPSASDAVGSPTVTANPSPGTMLPVGAHEVTVTATDAAGNAASCGFTITVTPKPDPGEPPGGETEAPQSCGCGPGASSLSSLVWLALGLLLRRRPSLRWPLQRA